MPHAGGTFDVTLKPLPMREGIPADANLGRMSIEKQFHGDLQGSSHGEMLTAGASVRGSAGYVAVELVRGSLHGRSGTFILQHSGAMNRGAPSLSVTVVPDSGSGELAGLAGQLIIRITGKEHFYEFDYTLPETP
jgi:hypothetical protein